MRISPGLWNPELSSRNPESGQLTIGILNLSPNDKRSRIQYMESRKKCTFLGVNVFSTNLLIGDTIVTLYFQLTGQRRYWNLVCSRKKKSENLTKFSR